MSTDPKPAIENAMEAGQINAQFAPLYSDLVEEDQYYSVKPLLAHYTSSTVLESMLRNGEIWLSNPLFMNDLEEVRFGINEGMEQFDNCQEIKEACRDPHRASLLLAAYRSYYNQFAETHAIDTYVFCLSLHDANDADGRLSMWRGYGGNGNGVAIVFDSSKIVPSDNAPLIIARVHYASGEERRRWIGDRLKQFAEILRNIEIPDDRLYVAAYSLFERVKLFALFTKHRGFEEEKEWRIVYHPEKDANRLLSDMMGYVIGSRGVETRLKVNVSTVASRLGSEITFDDLIHSIILGPSISSPLALSAVRRMLDHLSKPHLKDRLRASSIPFRA